MYSVVDVCCLITLVLDVGGYVGLFMFVVVWVLGWVVLLFGICDCVFSLLTGF